ncbi:hypothetical protein [Pleomorphomonas oryzae]|uniref:hypothetical protein n=1 Tax=Pleomorphomonas oryzae TaxID=261934 RepID=UPI0003FC53D3|nr:hypothetical protein [Pleomorphomonas oryzae]
MAKAFKKGDLVTLINNWDGRGTFSIQHAVVYSCGAKRMVLTDEQTGEEIGRNFQPVVGRGWALEHVFPRMAEENARAIALELGASVVMTEAVRIQSNRDRFPDSYSAEYTAGQLARLHEPRAAFMSELVAEIRAKLNA